MVWGPSLGPLPHFSPTLGTVSCWTGACFLPAPACDMPSEAFVEVTGLADGGRCSMSVPPSVPRPLAVSRPPGDWALPLCCPADQASSGSGLRQEAGGQCPLAPAGL